jgi:hypothetical protein
LEHLEKEELKKLAIKSVEEELNILNDFANNEGHTNPQVMLAICMRIDDLEDQLEDIKNPKQDIHHYFGLSYAQYLVLPRTVLQSMPLFWQRELVQLLQKLDEKDWVKNLPKGAEYSVQLRKYEYNSEDEFEWKEQVMDPLANYERGRRNIFN